MKAALIVLSFGFAFCSCTEPKHSVIPAAIAFEEGNEASPISDTIKVTDPSEAKTPEEVQQEYRRQVLDQLVTVPQLPLTGFILDRCDEDRECLNKTLDCMALKNPEFSKKRINDILDCVDEVVRP